jgi:phosphatidylserine/phosphatidylglycerophosphate/cardiolipin synthase-like enzyme
MPTIPALAKDKKLHLIVGVIIALVLYALFIHKGYELAAAKAIIVTGLVGLAKEYIWDKLHPITHTVDIWDAVYTGLGGILGIVGWKLLFVLYLSYLPAAHAEPIPNHIFKIDGACSVGFSPKGGIEGTLVKYIGSATKSVHVMAYGFTSLPIARALIAAKLHGVDVQVVLDRSNLAATASKLALIKTSGIPVWVDATHPISHDKVIIVDGNRIETGSYNYSNNAESANAENSMICPSIEGAALYEAHFKFHQAHSVKQ